MLHSKAQLAVGQWRVEHFDRAVTAADQQCGEPQLRLERQVRMVDQQYRCTLERAVVVINPGPQFAAQPGVEKHPFQLRTELPLPALFQIVEQGHQQLFAERASGVERHRLIEAIIQAALGQFTDGLHHGLAPGLPVTVGCFGWSRRRVKQRLDLADRDTTIEPQQNVLDALDVFGRKQAMTLGRAVRHDQAIAALPGTQSHGIHTGDARHFTNGQPAFSQCLAVVRVRGIGHDQVIIHGQMALRRLRSSGCGCR